MGVSGHECLELAGERAMAPGIEVGVDPGLERAEAQLLEPRRLRLGELLERDVRERLPAPEGERAVRVAVGQELLEAIDVELARLHADERTPAPW